MLVKTNSSLPPHRSQKIFNPYSNYNHITKLQITWYTGVQLIITNGDVHS